MLELLQRYNAPTPRYTSYPPAPHWHAAHREFLVSALRRSTAPLSIYVHIPFCERLCLYCGCNNADLIYGLPKQTRSSFQKTLDLVLDLSPDRLAVFSYAHVPSIKKQQRSFEKHLPPESEKLQLFVDAIQRLTSAGYEHIGMDHFARPGDPLVTARDNGTLHRNFQGYTTHGDTELLGFGVSAISHVGNTFTQNYREIPAWEDAINTDHLPVFRGYLLKKDDAIRGAVIEECLCNGRIPKDLIESRFQIQFDDYFMSGVTVLIEGRMSRTIRITPAGRVFVRAVARVFDAFQSSAVASKAV